MLTIEGMQPFDQGTDGSASVNDNAGVSPELWGGLECSVVRVGDTYRDQLRETGHLNRRGDLARVAALGVRRLRYPVLWEHVSPSHPDRCRWVGHDARLAELRALGVAPILGLVHHGSGPAYTNLLDPNFAPGLARHAARVAARYPWVEIWTPVNEPLTTARFSDLYGHWYPHARDEAAFLRMLVHQCRAVLLCMRAIRVHIPGAQLVQTEDIGRTFATPELACQAEDENTRRWLSYDLLCGRVDRHHSWHRRLLAAGVLVHDLEELQGGEAAPDILGMNHYVTSERFLDHRLHLYPAGMHGENGGYRYVDTEAVRAPVPDAERSWLARLREVWERYRRPLAITEVHMGCADPWHQVRWLLEAWEAARALRAAGADVRGVTPWSLFGAVDWNSLLCERAGHYEAGAFDAARSPSAPTLLAEVIGALGRGEDFAHAELVGPGWWWEAGRLHPELRPAA